MSPDNLKRLLLVFATVAVGILTGCLNEQSAVNTPTEVQATETETDPRVEYLVKEGDIRRELIFVTYDSLTRDTAYILEPPITAEQKKRGLMGTGIGFKASHLDKIMKAAKERRAQAAVVATGPSPASGRSGLLVKAGHTRWDHWYAPIDVKKLTEVRNVRVYIHKTGPAQLGSNWISAVRNAISNWNAQAKGTAVSFVETQSETQHDISFRGSYGLGSDGNLTSTAYLTADQFMNPDGIALYVNTAFENYWMPHNQKTTVAMSLLALSTNITFTGMEGYYWNNGTSIHIPGTPATDGDGYTPGSSILTYGTSSASTPVMTAGDIKAFRTVYPTFGDLSLNLSDALPGISSNVSIFQVSTDTVHYLRSDKKLFRRIGANGANVQLWPGSGSYGDPLQFLYSKGYLAVRTNSGRIYTRTPTGIWINQTPTYAVNPSDFRLDGNRLTVAIPSRTELRSYYLGPTTPSTQMLDWYMANGAITDWKIHNGLLVVVNAGNVYAMQDYQGWHVLHSASSGPAQNVQVSDYKIAIFYKPNGSSYSSVAVRHGLLSGWWSYYTDPVYHPDDIDLCGDKLAFLQQTNYLRIIDYSVGTVYAHYSIPTGTDFKKTRLSGPNCDFVTSISHWGPASWAKYGVDLDNQYVIYTGVVKRLSQGSVPDI